MIERGFESRMWMAQAIVANAHPTLLRRAVIELFDYFERVPDDRGMDMFEAVDMIIQISTTGHYHPPVVEDETVFSTELSPESVDKLLEVLRNAPEAEDVPDSYEDFLKRKGIDLGEPDDDEQGNDV